MYRQRLQEKKKKFNSMAPCLKAMCHYWTVY